LLRTVRFEKLTSDFRIYEKCLHAKRLTSEERFMVLDELETRAGLMYQWNYKGRWQYLWKLLRYRPRPYTLGMFFCSALSVPYQKFVAFHDWFTGSAEVKAT